MLGRSTPSDDLAPLVRYVSQIEHQQAVNILAQTQNEPIQLQLPILPGDVLTSVLPSIKQGAEQRHSDGKNGKRAPAGYRILFALDLAGFGQTRIEVHVKDQTLGAILC